MAQAPNQGQSVNQAPPVKKKGFKWGCNLQSALQSAFVLALLAGLFGILNQLTSGILPNVCWFGIVGSRCNPTSTPGTPPLRAYNFEDGAQGWEFVTKQPDEKQSLLEPAKGHGYNSQGSLELNTAIWGSGNATIPVAGSDDYTHTAIRVFFPNENDLGKKVSCHLYFPDILPKGVYFRLFVISDKQDTDSYEYGKDKLYPQLLGNKTWVELSMTIGDPENEKQPQFDPTHVNYIGMNVQGNGGPNMGRTLVKVLLDDCTIT